MAKKKNNPSTPKVQPVEEIRIGSIKAAIWRNDGENGARFNDVATRQNVCARCPASARMLRYARG